MIDGAAARLALQHLGEKEMHEDDQVTRVDTPGNSKDSLTASQIEVNVGDAERLEPALLTYLTATDPIVRDAAFLHTYAERIRNGTAATWEIPSTVAGTIDAIANRLTPCKTCDPLRAALPSTDEDFATLLELHQQSPAPVRVAAFLRLYAGRIRQNERWDVPETMAKAYENAARVLDEYASQITEVRAALGQLAQQIRTSANATMVWTNHPEFEPKLIYSAEERAVFTWCADQLAALIATLPQLIENKEDAARVAPLTAGVVGQDLPQRGQSGEVTAAERTEP